METLVPQKDRKATAASLHTPCNIGNMPLEVLLNIFRYFDVQDLEYTISPVCQLWNDLSQRACLRRKLVLKGEGLNAASACELLRSCPKLKDLTIMDREDADILLHHVALYNHDLHRLEVARCTGSPTNSYIAEQVLDEVLLRCPHIVDLAIKHSCCNSKTFYSELCVRLPELRKINVNFSLFLGSDDLKLIVLHCSKLEDIRVLGSRFYPLCCDRDILLLAQCLRGNLKVLKINAAFLTDESVAALAQCSHLRKVHFVNACNITDGGVFNLSRLRNLESLCLINMKRVTPVGWVRMFSESLWKQMKKLSLALCENLNDYSLYHVVGACPNLVKIDLSGCRHITDEGLRSVFQLCTNLEHLNVYAVGNEYIFRSFPLIPLHTRHLKRLMYKPCGLEEEDRVLQDLEDKLPELYISTLINKC